MSTSILATHNVRPALMRPRLDKQGAGHAAHIPQRRIDPGFVAHALQGGVRHVLRLNARQRARLVAVGSAVLVGLVVWAIDTLFLGGEVRTPALGGIPEPMPIGAADVIFVTGFLSLAAWASLAVLERLIARGRNVWAILAGVTLILSLATPLAGTGISAANRVVLLLIHISVGLVLIPLLYRSSQQRSLRSGSER